MDTQVFEIRAGETGKIDAIRCGISVDGPALIVCVKGKDLEKTKSVKVAVENEFVCPNCLTPVHDHSLDNYCIFCGERIREFLVNMQTRNECNGPRT